MNTWKQCKRFDIKEGMRLRITFSKSGALRYTGHLDLQTTWERTIRRAGLPLAYTHGFHPGPRIQIASALPLGFIGRAEIVDIWLQEPVGTGLAGAWVDTLQPAAPPGLTILSVEQVDEAGPALQTRVVSAEYAATLLDPVDQAELAQRLAAALNTESLPRERRGKPYNLRPLIEALSILPVAQLAPTPSQSGLDATSGNGQVGGQGLKIFMRLAARDGATARPEAVLEVLGIPFETTRIERTRLILNSGIE
jgi:radical SAM-linked protein